MLGDNVSYHEIGFTGSWCPHYQCPSKRINDIYPATPFLPFDIVQED